MTEYVTYESKNAKPNERWLAYAILPNGQQWLVRCTGETEEIALTKAKTLYEAELAKVPTQYKISDQAPKPAKSHHNAGKIWMVNRETNHKVRIDPSEESKYGFQGYVRGGPRS